MKVTQWIIVQCGMIFDAINPSRFPYEDGWFFTPIALKIRILNVIRFGKGKIKPLSSLEKLYAETIVYLPLESQIHYCENLISCCNYDLKETKKKSEIRKIKEIIRSAEHELEKLNKQ